MSFVPPIPPPQAHLSRGSLAKTRDHKKELASVLVVDNLILSLCQADLLLLQAISKISIQCRYDTTKKVAPTKIAICTTPITP